MNSTPPPVLSGILPADFSGYAVIGAEKIPDVPYQPSRHVVHVEDRVQGPSGKYGVFVAYYDPILQWVQDPSLSIRDLDHATSIRLFAARILELNGFLAAANVFRSAREAVPAAPGSGDGAVSFRPPPHVERTAEVGSL